MVGFEVNDTVTTNQKLISGCLSGCITRFLVQPMDVIKIRAQVQKNRHMKGSLMLGILRGILKEEGVTAFWHGHNLGQLHSILSMGVQFYSYELSTQYSDHLFDADSKMTQKFLCGVLSGFAVTATVMPVEVIRVRQIIVKEQYKSFVSGAKGVYRTGGLRAFYEGLGTSLLMMGPANGITFLVFTSVQPFVLHVLAESSLKKSQTKPGAPHSAMDVLISSSVAGSIAGFLAKFFVYPLDLMKKRLQIGSHERVDSVNIPSQATNLFKCTKLMNCFRQSYKEHGLKGLYTGLIVSVLKSQLTMVISFSTYELLCLFFRIHNEVVQ